MEDIDKGIKKSGIFFRAYGSDRGEEKAYPAWRYHKFYQPVLVENTKEDRKIRRKGFKPLGNLQGRPPYLMDFMADFEDMSPRQIVLYAKEEFDIDLPVEAGHTRLLRAIWRLTQNSPKNKDRIILLAQSVRMNYDATLKEIKRVIETSEAEVERKVIYA